MTPKEYLRQYAALNAEIDCKFEEKRQLEALAMNISAAFGSGSGGSGVSDKVGKNSARIADLEKEIDKKIDRLVDLREEIETAIAAVEDSRCRTLLEEHYINGKSWEKVAEVMGYSYYHTVARLHPKALKEISKHVTKCY